MKQDIDDIVERLRLLESPEQVRRALSEMGQLEKTGIVNQWKHSLRYLDYQENIQSLSQIVKIITLLEPELHTQVSPIKKSEYLELSQEDIELIARFLDVTKAPDATVEICHAVHRRKRGTQGLSKYPAFFKSLLQSFEFIEGEEPRQQALTMVLELMIENPELIDLGNKPYYCLQYFIYRLNQENDPSKLMQFFKYLSDIYLLPHSEKLFTTNDSKAMVDVLVRQAQNAEEESTLVNFVRFYLVLSLNPNTITQGQYYELERIILVVECIQKKSAQLTQLTLELHAMKSEKF